MKDTLTKITLGIITVVSGGAYVPVIPSDLDAGLTQYPTMRGYQYVAGSDRTDFRYVATTTAKGVATTSKVSFGPLPDADFTDEDGNGVISVAVYRDRKGQDVYKKITDAEYKLMGDVGGAQNNPKKTELITVFEALAPAIVPVAEAAIAIDATSTGFLSSGTSLTFSHTITGTNPALLCGVFSFAGGDALTSIKYNGNLVAQKGSQAADAGGRQYLHGYAATTTGANNVVVTYSTSVQIFATCASYTGVDPTTPFPDAAITSIKTGTTISLPATSVTVDQSWLVASGRSPSKAPTASAGTIVRKLNPTSGDAAWVLDSNGPRSTGANSLDYTQSGSVNNYNTIIAIAPAASAPSITPNQNIILFSE